MNREFNLFNLMAVIVVGIIVLGLAAGYYDHKKGERKMAVEDFTEVYVQYGETINMGNYESMRFDIGVRRNLREGESPKEVIDSLTTQVKQQWQRKADELSK